MLVHINGNQLDVEVLGPTDAPVMIVHHGAPGLGSKAEPKASFGPLADTYRIVIFDARGSGVSQDNAPLTHEQWAADVDALRDWVGAEQIIMAGGSYGGFIAMEYAIRYPERVTALILRDTSPDNSNEELSRANALASTRVDLDLDKFYRIMDGLTTSDEDLKECWAEILPLYDHTYDPQAVAHKVGATPYRYQTHNWAFTRNMPTYDIKAQLPAINCPTLVTVGRDDWITPVSCSETITDLIPNAELVVFEESGHSPQVEEAPRFQKVIREFLTRTLPTHTKTH